MESGDEHGNLAQDSDFSVFLSPVANSFPKLTKLLTKQHDTILRESAGPMKIKKPVFVCHTLIAR